MLVCIINIGNINYSKHSLEILDHYFNKFNIRYKILTDFGNFNIKNAHPSWMKCLLHKIFKHEEFILAWDLDLIPVKNSPNIVDVLDKTKLNLVYDTSVVLGYKCYRPETFKYNCGLIGIPNSYANWIEQIYNKNAPGTYPSWEQYYINDMIEYDCLKVNRLPDEWNVLYPKKEDGWEIWNRAILKHFSFGGFINPPDIVKTIESHKQVYFS